LQGSSSRTVCSAGSWGPTAGFAGGCSCPVVPTAGYVGLSFESSFGFFWFITAGVSFISSFGFFWFITAVVSCGSSIGFLWFITAGVSCGSSFGFFWFITAGVSFESSFGFFWFITAGVSFGSFFAWFIAGGSFVSLAVIGQEAGLPTPLQFP